MSIEHIPIRDKKYEIKCPSCTEPGLSLSWKGRNAQGKNEYWEKTQNGKELHVCKRKYLRTVSCRKCGEKELRWRKANTPSGWELYNLRDESHFCIIKPKVTDKDKELGYFWRALVIWDDDTEEVKKIKMARQDKLMHRMIDGEVTDMEIIADQYNGFYTKHTYSSK